MDWNKNSYNRFLGLNLISRKIAKSVPSTTQLIKLNEIEYAINTVLPFKTQQQKFVPGQECDACTIDGRKIKNLFSIDGMIIIEQQIEPGRMVTITREFSEEEIVGEIVVGKVMCKFWCEAIE